MILICYVFLQDHVTKRLSKFMGRVFEIALRSREKRRKFAGWNVSIG